MRPRCDLAMDTCDSCVCECHLRPRWSVERLDKFPEDTFLERRHTVGLPTLTNRLNEEHLAEVDSLCTEAGTTVRTLAFNRPIVFFCVPEGLQVQEDCFVTPISYVARHNLKLTTPEVPPAPVPPAPSQMVPVIARAGRHERRAPPQQFEICCVAAAMECSTCNGIGHVVKHVIRMFSPDTDLTNMAYPDKEQIRRWIIRLDMLVMLAARRIFTKPVRVARYLAPDSSPQGKYDYLNCVEELMIRSSPIKIDEPFNPFGGFEWQRRLLPVMPIGRGEGSTAGKLHLLTHMALLEAGEGNLSTWRMSTKGFVSDQGTERHLPHALFGSQEEVADSIARLKAGTLHLQDAKRSSFLPFALQNFGIWHVVFNALQSAIEGQPQWPSYLQQLRAVCN